MTRLGRPHDASSPVGGVNVGAALVGGAAMAASHGGSFGVNFVGRGEYRHVSSARQMSAPYRRAFVLHLTVVFGAFLVVSSGSPVVLVALLVALKAGVDVRAHLREHEQVRERHGDGTRGAA